MPVFLPHDCCCWWCSLYKTKTKNQQKFSVKLSSTAADFATSCCFFMMKIEPRTKPEESKSQIRGQCQIIRGAEHSVGKKRTFVRALPMRALFRKKGVYN